MGSNLVRCVHNYDDLSYLQEIYKESLITQTMLVYCPVLQTTNSNKKRTVLLLTNIHNRCVMDVTKAGQRGVTIHILSTLSCYFVSNVMVAMLGMCSTLWLVLGKVELLLFVLIGPGWDSVCLSDWWLWWQRCTTHWIQHSKYVVVSLVSQSLSSWIFLNPLIEQVVVMHV